MRKTPLGTGLSCRAGHPFFLQASILLILLFSSLLTTAQTQVQWLQTGNNIYNPNTGNVGIGTNNPGALLDVQGNLLFFTGSNQMYFNGGVSFDPTKAGIRCNGGNPILQAHTGGTLYLNRDVSSDTYIESSPGPGLVTEIATFKANGYVGIGTTTPRTTLDVNGSFYLGRPSAMVDAMNTIGITSGSYLGLAPSDLSSSNPGYISFFFPDNNSFRMGTNYDGHLAAGGSYRDLQFGRYVGDAYMTIKDGGNVLIGKPSQSNTGYKLDVNGNARMNQVVVNTTGADYVFDAAYHLPRLEEIETFIRKEHHLPGIAPATAMEREGMDLGDTQTHLLAKVEELTLYLIEQDKEIRKLKQENQELKDIKDRLARLEHYLANSAGH